MARVFTFRGKTLDELKAMPVKAFGQLCNARARRSLLRGQDKKLTQKVLEASKRGIGTPAKPIRTHLRDALITPQMVGLVIAVHNGKAFVPIHITGDMLGHYLGEMVLTRKKLVHGKAGIGATKSSTAITARG